VRESDDGCVRLGMSVYREKIRLLTLFRRRMGLDNLFRSFGFFLLRRKTILYSYFGDTSRPRNSELSL